MIIKKNVKLFKQFLLLFFIITNSNSITLEKAVFQTLHTNPQIKEKLHGLEGVKQEKDLVNSAYYPKINISAGVGKAKEKISPSYNSQTGEIVVRTDNSISTSMNLFKGLYTYYDSASLKHRINAEESYTDEYKTIIAMQVIESYIDLLKQKAILLINKENVVAHEEYYKKLKEYTDSGIGKISDLKLLSGRLTLAKINAVVYENNFIQSKINFEMLLGYPIDSSQLNEHCFDYFFPSTLEEAAQIALKNNPSIKLNEYNIKSAKSNYKRSQSVYYPSVDLEIKESWFNERGSYKYSVNSSYAMMYLTYNIFNGFADKAMVEKEFSLYLQNKQFLLFTRRDVLKKLSISWIAAFKIEEQFELLTKMKMDSKSTLDDYYKEYLFGRRTLLDIINVKNDYDNARQSHVSAKYDILLSKFRILNSMGGLLEYFTKKSQQMQLKSNEDFSEETSVYNIVENLDNELQINEEFIIFNHDDYNSLDTINSEIDDLNQLDNEADVNDYDIGFDDDSNETEDIFSDDIDFDSDFNEKDKEL